MSENTPNTSPEPIEGNPVDVQKTLNKRRAVVVATAAGVAGLVAGINGLSSAEGVPCDPVMDNGCIPDPTTSSLPEFTKPSVPESSTTVVQSSTTVAESSTTVPASSTTVAQSSTTTHVSTPPGMPPMTFEVTPQPQEPTQDGTPNADRTT